MPAIPDGDIPKSPYLTHSEQAGLQGLSQCLSVSCLSSLLRSCFAQVGSLLYNIRDVPAIEQCEKFFLTEKRKRDLSWNLPRATSLHEWLQIAGELDELEGNNAWKAIDESDEYDYVIIRERLENLKRALDTNDLASIIHNIRTTFSRDLANMTNPDLYGRAYIGSKNLIDLYVTTAVNAVSMVLQLVDELDLNVEESQFLLHQLQASRQAFGRSALLLSGGATFGMNHTGVVKTLWQMRLLPRIISGSSAGGVIAGVLCTHTDDEIPKILSSLAYEDFCVFEPRNEVESVIRRLKRFLQTGSLFDIVHLRKVMQDLLGNITFLEAYNRTRRILNITVSHSEFHELPRLLNYITSPNVMVWSAMYVLPNLLCGEILTDINRVTSCSVPLVFSASSLMAKDPVTGEILDWGESLVQWIDGSVDGDLPMARLSEMFNVNHFIVSQVNPHVIPFVPPEEAFLFAELSERRQPPENGKTHLPKELMKEEAMGKLNLLSGMGLFPNTLRRFASIMRQEYYGDINILPEITYEVFPSMLRNPTPDFMLRACLTGERATWPKLGRIRNHCAVELALDAAIPIMRDKVAAIARSANIPMKHLTFYTDEDLYLEDNTAKIPQKITPKNSFHGAHTNQIFHHSNPVFEVRKSRSSIHMASIEHSFTHHTHHFHAAESKTHFLNPASLAVNDISGHTSQVTYSELDTRRVDKLSSVIWPDELTSLSRPVQPERHVPTVLPHRGSYARLPTPLIPNPPIARKTRRANNSKLFPAGVTLPRFIMTMKSGPPSPVPYRHIRQSSSELVKYNSVVNL
ncbi:Lipase 5 [Ophidiomyces ophidiicola]|nr:Lipase 5 [Ophidiomyces ophidiicola]KAI1990362.1 Lipase 5 [Ophidiomyces ophidiicola]